MESPIDEQKAWDLYEEAKQIIERDPNNPNCYAGDYHYVVVLGEYAIRFLKPGKALFYSNFFRDQYGAQRNFAQQVRNKNPAFQVPNVYYNNPKFAVLEAARNPSKVSMKDLRPYIDRAKTSLEGVEKLAEVSNLDVRLDFIRCSTEVPVNSFHPYLQEGWSIDDNRLNTRRIIDEINKEFQQHITNNKRVANKLFQDFSVSDQLVTDVLVQEVDNLQQRPPIFVHLDLKSYNLLYPDHDYTRRPYVIDFDYTLVAVHCWH